MSGGEFKCKLFSRIYCTECILHRQPHRKGKHERGFANCFAAVNGAGVGTRWVECGIEHQRNVVDGWDFIGSRSEVLQVSTMVVPEFFGEAPPEALHECPFYLPQVNGRME